MPIPTKREKSLGTAKMLGALLIILGIANGVGGIIVGHRITQAAVDEFGGRTTEISPTGVAFIANSIAIGVILLIAGGVVIAFANAISPGSEKPAYAPAGAPAGAAPPRI
jgi:hypothetical protein